MLSNKKGGVGMMKKKYNKPEIEICTLFSQEMMAAEVVGISNFKIGKGVGYENLVIVNTMTNSIEF